MKYQKDCCAVCEVHKSNFKKDLAVDHNHRTGTVRGLLCPKCNTALGLLEENEERIFKLLDYIRKNEEL